MRNLTDETAAFESLDLRSFWKHNNRDEVFVLVRKIHGSHAVTIQNERGGLFTLPGKTLAELYHEIDDDAFRAHLMEKSLDEIFEGCDAPDPLHVSAEASIGDSLPQRRADYRRREKRNGN